MKVAIVHDWLIGGGAEKVVLELHKMYPEAPIYTSYATKEWQEMLDGKVVTGYLQHWPFSKLRKFLPVLRIWWFTHLKFDGFDLVISSSGAEAKGIKVPESVVHVNYCYAPTHYYWSRYDEYLKNPGFGVLDPVARLGLKLLIAPLRKWDYKAAQRPDKMIAISTYIQQQIKKYYGRDADIVFPPVDIERFRVQSTENRVQRKGFVITGRQTPYKRFDLAVEACTKLGLPLSVIGTGPEHERLKKLAGPSVVFKGWLKTEEVITALQSSEAFLFPGMDDFGMAPVEAMAAGTPVVAYRAGGALDYVIPGQTGNFFDRQTIDSLASSLKDFNSMQFSHDTIAAEAERYSPAHFRSGFLAVVATLKQ